MGGDGTALCFDRLSNLKWAKTPSLVFAILSAPIPEDLGWGRNRSQQVGNCQLPVLEGQAALGLMGLVIRAREYPMLLDV